MEHTFGPGFRFATHPGNVGLRRLPEFLKLTHWKEVALQKPYCIFSEDRPSQGKGDARKAMAMPICNVERLVTIAAFDGHAAAVAILLFFAAENDVSNPINRFAVQKAVENGDAATVESMVTADPNVISISIPHGKQPVDIAVSLGKTEVVAVLLDHGAKPVSSTAGSRRPRGYMTSLLALSTRSGSPRMTELLLRHGAHIPGSGALHHAADHGNQALDTMRLLLNHGADVDERLAEDRLPRSLKPSLLTTWTPMHFAAFRGKLFLQSLF